MSKECIHHWMLPTPNGEPRLEGRCQKCGQERSFPTVQETEDSLRTPWARRQASLPRV